MISLIMTTLEIEEISYEKDSLIRSCNVNIGGTKVITPTRTVSLTKSNDVDLKIAKNFIGKNYRPFGEVYANLSLDSLSKIKDDDEFGKKYSNKISNKLLNLKSEGAVPYLVLSITDNNRNPYNQMLPNDILELIFDILWGTPGNSIVVPPLMGLLPNNEDYIKLINAMDNRIKMNIDRKNLPIMATIPSSYNLIDPKLLEEYWNIGCRMFAFNCENKKYGGFGYMIEKLHKELTILSKKSEDNYLLSALNSKFKVGRQESSRIHNLLGTGFGFDVYSPNHIVPKFIPDTQTNYYLFNSDNYGFNTLSEICTGNEEYENILDSIAFKNLDLETIEESCSSNMKRNITQKYNTEESIKEISLYSQYINDEELYKYFSEKQKIANDVSVMEKISDKMSYDIKPLDAWF